MQSNVVAGAAIQKFASDADAEAQLLLRAADSIDNMRGKVLTAAAIQHLATGMEAQQQAEATDLHPPCPAQPDASVAEQVSPPSPPSPPRLSQRAAHRKMPNLGLDPPKCKREPAAAETDPAEPKPQRPQSAEMQPPPTLAEPVGNKQGETQKVKKRVERKVVRQASPFKRGGVRPVNEMASLPTEPPNGWYSCTGVDSAVVQLPWCRFSSGTAALV